MLRILQWQRRLERLANRSDRNAVKGYRSSRQNKDEEKQERGIGVWNNSDDKLMR